METYFAVYYIIRTYLKESIPGIMLKVIIILIKHKLKESLFAQCAIPNKSKQHLIHYSALMPWHFNGKILPSQQFGQEFVRHSVPSILLLLLLLLETCLLWKCDSKLLLFSTFFSQGCRIQHSGQKYLNFTHLVVCDANLIILSSCGCGDKTELQ